MKRRLTDEEMLIMARPGAPHPDLEVGDDVYVLFQFQDPVEATVVGGIDHGGWVEVEQDFQGEPLKFETLATCCVKRGDSQKGES